LKDLLGLKQFPRITVSLFDQGLLSDAIFKFDGNSYYQDYISQSLSKVLVDQQQVDGKVSLNSLYNLQTFSLY